MSPLRFIYRITEEKEFQLAVGVSSKNFRKAVDRNRIKRLIKESYRLERLSLKEKLSENQKGMHVFITYIGKELPDHKTIHAAVIKGLSKLEKTINENSASHT